MSTPFDVDLFEEAIQDLDLEEDDFIWIIADGYDTWEEILEEHQAIEDPMLYLQLGTLANVCMKEEGTVGEYDAEDLNNDVFFHHGDLFVDGNLDVVSGFLVTGDLHVSDSITDNGPDSLVIVLGDVHTTHLYASGEFHVLGDIKAENGVVYGSDSEAILNAETIYARIVIEEGHEIQAAIDAEYYFDSTTDKYAITEQLEDLLVFDVFDDDKLLSPSLMFEVIKNGDSIFQDE